MKYDYFTVDDFALDPQFRMWVLEGTSPNFDWENWLKENPHKKAEVLRAKHLLEASIKSFEKISGEEASKEAGKIINLIQRREETIPTMRANRNNRWKYFAAAASVLLVSTITWFFALNSNADEPTESVVSSVLDKGEDSEWMIIENARNENKLVVLPDGSSLLLKKNSRITFPSHFPNKERNVYLHGEAFFEVVKNVEHPFVIYSNSFTTHVVGTSFMLTDFPDSKTNGIVVKTGVVRVLPSAFKKSAVNKDELIAELYANESWTQDSQKINAWPATVEVRPALSEKIQSSDFKYRNTSLIEILEELEQTYNVTFQYDKNELADLKLSATLSDEPFFRKLDLIAMALNLDYTVRGNDVLISKK